MIALTGTQGDVAAPEEVAPGGTFVCEVGPLEQALETVSWAVQSMPADECEAGVLVTADGDDMVVTAASGEWRLSVRLPAQEASGSLLVSHWDAEWTIDAGMRHLDDSAGDCELVRIGQAGDAAAMVEVRRWCQDVRWWPVEWFPESPGDLVGSVVIAREAFGNALTSGVALGVPGAHVDPDMLMWAFERSHGEQVVVNWQLGTGRPWVSIRCGEVTLVALTARG